jgi:hypothetical protein
LPQKAQKLTSAGSGCPQCRQAITARALGAGRPQWEQKCDPMRSGAPHWHRVVPARPPGAAVAAKSSESSSCMRCSMLRTSPARSIRSSGRKRSRRTISTVRPPTSRISTSRRLTSERRSPRSWRGCGMGSGAGGPSATSSSTMASPFSGGTAGTASGGGCARRLRAQGMCGESNGRSRRLELDDDEAVLGHLAHRIVRALARVPRGFRASVGHLVGAEGGRLVHGDAAELEL